MSAPLCVGCEEAPVRRARKDEMPARMVDGIAWRRFCSRGCVARAVGHQQRGSAAATAGLLERNRHAYRARARKRLEDAALPLASRFDGPIQELMKAFWVFDQKAYRRGFAAAWAQHRRKALA